MLIFKLLLTWALPGEIFATTQITCIDMETDPLGESYAGEISTTRSGLTCQMWASQSPNTHDTITE